ncbi:MULTISPECIES: TetR/AcrR family transcriptional regulator [Mycobacterium]|uniref:TetR family transcriptional regulator n=1 Tax=Mycobacterium syngnathidarum TaxID=1908205 RepID=A0A1S1JU92_9MYCO|nr:MULTISPECIES: TetR/AcrR family transcriptional regulator [Mycobacterium]MCG7609959.1 TetR/AcrR family transcriptional regulator [Mycobacterium sp. CnD-18-1]OHT93501.1 TetR family transcriptional regulator [Mycobacterium syngnathidarum]OLT96233.1 TetR family transcriptional regulator [Mycobacterium syngnathidarum]
MDTPAGSRHRRQGSRPDPSIDEAVLATTRKLLVDRGYAATSIDLIATTAGVSRPTIYRRWKSKALLVHEAVFPDLDPAAPSDDIVAEITRLCRGAYLLFRDPAVRESIPGLLTELRADSDIRGLMTERLDAAARTQLASLVDDAAAQGRARRYLDVDTVMDAIGGAAMYAVCVRGIDDTEEAVERAATDLADLILRGLLAQPAG